MKSTKNWSCPEHARKHWDASERDFVQCQHREDVGGFSPAAVALQEMPVTARSLDSEPLLCIVGLESLGEIQPQHQAAQQQLAD